jgi:tetratricopeptide (TPR) repeat protein
MQHARMTASCARVTLLGIALLVAPAAASAQGASLGAPDAGLAPASQKDAAPAGGELATLLPEADAVYGDRDAPGKLDAVKEKLEAAEKLAPGSFEALWRLARYYFWVSDDPKLAEAEKSRLGKLAWEYGDKATQADPSRVEGWFFASGGVGNFSLGIGVVKALLQGIEGKFTDRLKKAEQIDSAYDGGGVDVSWGRYYYELPWPKYDGEKCERHLQKALRVNPRNVRARVYLAELYFKEDHPKHAKAQLEKALANPPGAYDAPEERRYQERARELLSKAK